MLTHPPVHLLKPAHKPAGTGDLRGAPFLKGVGIRIVALLRAAEIRVPDRPDNSIIAERLLNYRTFEGVCPLLTPDKANINIPF